MAEPRSRRPNDDGSDRRGTGGADARRLLAGGETLREDWARPNSGRAGKPVRTPEEAQLHLLPQLTATVAGVRRLDRAVRAQHVVIEATILPNYLAASHYPEQLFEAANLYTVGTRQARGTYRTPKRVRENEPTKTYLLAGTDDAVERLAEIVARGPRSGSKKIWQQIAEFEEVRLPGADTVVRGAPADPVPGEVITWEAVLSELGRTPEERASLRHEVLEKFSAHVERLGGEVDLAYARTLADLTFVPVGITATDIEAAAAFNALRVVRPMPVVADVMAMLRDLEVPVMPTAAAAPVAEPPLTPIRVAVFDGGVDMSDALVAPYVTQHDVTPEPARPRGVQHGAMVTNAVLYGYGAADRAKVPPLVRVDHYRFFPPPPLDGVVDTQMYWMLDRIEERVVADKHALVNLSIAPFAAVDDDAEPHRWTAVLDRLAVEHGVLFVVAAGNYPTLPAGRVMTPADMANAAAVGACTSRDGTRPLSRAPYSATGPGRPGQRVAPLGVTFGGVLGSAEPFRAVGLGGVVVEQQGTSLAAPLVTHGLAGLAAGLEAPRARPETLRAFAAHCASGEYADGHDERDLGYGRLCESYAHVWTCAPNEVTVLYEATLARGMPSSFLLPFPDGVSDDVPVDVRFTVAYTSPVQSHHAGEYTRAGLDVFFRPHERMRALYSPPSGPGKKEKKIGDVDLERDAALIQATLAKHGRISGEPTTLGGWRRSKWEGDLRDGGKWETVLRAAPGPLIAGAVYRPRVDLDYFYRDGARLVRADEDAPPLRVAMVATLAVRGDVSLYDLVRAQYRTLIELQPNVTVPAAVPVRVGGAL